MAGQKTKLSKEAEAQFLEKKGLALEAELELLTRSWHRKIAPLVAIGRAVSMEPVRRPYLLKSAHLRRLTDGWPSGTLRYFSPREVANLMGFPQYFRFPPDVSVSYLTD